MNKWMEKENKREAMRLEVLTAVIIKITIFCGGDAV
jgi:hypothetical protein